LRVLHITNWYPTPESPYEAIWIKRHVNALAKHLESYHVLHLDIRPASKFFRKKYQSPSCSQRIFGIPVRHWRIVEIAAAILLAYYLLKLRVYQKYDLITAHIAYPNLTYWHFLRRLFPLPIVITEHWSAYHFNFAVVETEKLRRIQRIFERNRHVIAVSNALLADIAAFSQVQLKGHVVPNVADMSTFFFRPGERTDTFFMAGYWKTPKRPLVIMEAFRSLSEVHGHFELVVGGYGPDIQQMRQWAEDNGMAGRIKFLGMLKPEDMANQFRSCLAFLHCSDYETFSVVCAEALCCGTPIIASKVGGIPEFVNETNGVLVDENSVEEWIKAMNALVNTRHNFDSESISRNASDRFSEERVGRLYFDVLCHVLASGSK
jgi:glycosyltransferase involved in cell wall biosynthesis